MEDNNTKSINNKKLLNYDVFISHANKDKIRFVNDLYKSLSKLNINIFYDKDVFKWGDNWKSKIYEGLEKSEFAIIVISKNYFGREWTEKELKELLNRQNRTGQKIVLPILYKVSIDEFKNRYPDLAAIQVLEWSNFKNCDQISLLFAEQLIKRLKEK